MRKQLLALLLTATLLPSPALALTELLFVGNSHTGTNNLADMFDSLAESGGHPVYVDVSSVGSSTLSYHSTHQPTLDKIHARDWDFVVLQEHTLLPVIPYWVENSFHPMATYLDSIITNSGSHTALFAHQAYPYPSGDYCVLEHCSREFDDYFDMQQEMSAAYPPLAEALDVPVARVGDVWANALAYDPTLPLWSGDNVHASLEGSYLTACVFYVTFLGESPVGLPYTAGLDPLRALIYQQLALSVTAAGDTPPAATALKLSAYPNPFNPRTQIRFELAEPAEVTLQLFDTAGRRVSTLESGTRLEAGAHGIDWSGRDDSGRELAAGVYVLRLEAGSAVEHRKLTLLK